MANSYLRLTLTESAVNIGNNTSVVSVNVVVQMQNGYSGYSGYATSVSISCDGQGATINVPSYNIAANGSMNLGTVSFTIGHNTDGSKSVGASATWYANNSYVGTPSGSASKTLTTIPRATTPTLAYSDSAKRMGTNLTIGLPAASSAFTHNVSYKFGDVSGAIASGIKTSTVWTMPKTLAIQIPNSASGNGSIIVDTFNGSSKIGTKEVSFSTSVSDEMIPTFRSLTATRVDNGVPSTFGIYVQGYSKVTLTINEAVGSNGSTIKSFMISGDGYSSNKQSDTFGALMNAGVVTFTGTITDSRGKTASKTITITVYEYQPPTLTLTAERCKADGTVSNEGTYLLIKPVYSCVTVNGKNYITGKAFSCGSYSNSTCASGGSCIIGSGAIAVNQQYDIIGKVTDAMGKTVSIITHVGTSAVAFNIKSNGKGIGFGKYAEKDGVFESQLNIEVNGNPVYPVKKVNGFYGFEDIPDYLRTPQLGLIPHHSGGSGSIGASSWPFNTGYIKNLYLDDLMLKNIKVLQVNTSNQTELLNNDVKIEKNLTLGGSIHCDTAYIKNVFNSDTAHALWSLKSGSGDIWNMMWGNPSHTYLHYNTSNGAFGVNCWASDKSLKKHIRATKVNRALDTLSRIKHVEFDWNSSEAHVPLGYIADDLEELLPCLIYNVEQYGEDGKPNGKVLKHINETTVIPLITMGIQEIIQEIEYFWEFNDEASEMLLMNQNEIKNLKEENEKLKLRMAAVEAKIG